VCGEPSGEELVAAARFEANTCDAHPMLALIRMDQLVLDSEVVEVQELIIRAAQGEV